MLKYVLTPISINGKTIPNRVVRTAHTTNFGQGTMSDELIAYHEARARGGVGLTILETLGVHDSSPGTMNISHPDLKSGYTQLVSACKPHGMMLFQQLWHGGHQALPLDGSPPWSASNIASALYGVVPLEMTRDQIGEIVNAFASAATLCESAGLDGVEVHAAHGYLIQQFMSPLLNKRNDEYGGDFDNRLRFTLEILQAIRNVVNTDFPIGIRLSPEATPGGLTSDDNARIVEILEAQALVDYVNVSLGGYIAAPPMIGGMNEPTGYQLPTSLPVTATAKAIPTIITGRYRTLEEADQAIRSGAADLIGMTRAHIADPEIVRKTIAERVDEIRPCIACNQGCVGGLSGPEMRMACTVNAAVGYEMEIGDDKLQLVETAKKVMVVGGGPAGMEAARVAALRGHKVILTEATTHLGGQLNLACQAPRHVSIIDVAHWQEREIFRLGVDVLFSTYVDAEDVYSEKPDVLIVATGSTPRMDGIQSARPGQPATGIGQAHVISTSDLFAISQNRLGTSALVADDVGHYEAIAAAEYLIDLGISVTFLTRHSAFGHLLEMALITEPALQRLRKGGFTLMTRTQLVDIGKNEVIVEFLDGGSEQTISAETVVLVSLNAPERSLYYELTDFAGDVHMIGDANSPRFLATAIAEGFHIGATV